MVRAIDESNLKLVRPARVTDAAAAAAPSRRAHSAHACEHFVQFYESDEFLLDSLSGYVREGLEAGEACVVIATREHREGLCGRINSCGLDADAARDSGRLVLLDAAETLSLFMSGDAPDPSRFREVVGEVIGRAAEGGRRVRAFGEMVALLWAEGKGDAALRLEALWNELGASHEFRLFCAYPLKGFEGDADASALGRVCEAHARVVPAESYASHEDSDERLRAVIELQLKARALDAEAACRRAAEAELCSLREEVESRAEENARLVASERAARVEAENANRLRDEFLRTVSHELRTPLTAILGWSHLLVKTRLDEATAARALDTIERNAMAQAQLVEDILDVARAITGRLKLEVGPTDLAAVVNEAVDSVQRDAASKEISVEVILDPSARHVRGDAARLKQVASNLLSNAVKFTPRGGHVRARLSRAGSHAELAVSDTGQGIAPDFLPHVFDRFRQADQSTTRAHGGLGLGLAIVRCLVELHGGTVRAESGGEGRGSTFTVTLPADDTDL